MRDDVRSAMRQIRRNPLFVCAAVLTLALGAGAVTAVLSLADPMLFRPLPFPGGDRIFVASASRDRLHMPDAGRAEEAHGAWESLGDFNGPVDIGRINAATTPSLSYAVSRGFLPALGVTPVLGRAFRDEEYTRSHPPEVAIITHALWQNAFGGRPDALQQRLTFEGPRGHSYQIVGVLPASFFFPDVNNQQPVALLPGAMDVVDARPNVVVFPFLRLRPGVSAATATAELQTIVRRVEQDYPAFERERRVELIPLREALFGRVRTPLLMLVAATACVLLAASANLAQLVMARLRVRRREFGIRLALGASRGRLVRQLSIEALLLAALGAIAALVTGAALSRLAMAYAPDLARMYQVMPPALDGRIAAITGGIVLGTLVIFGVVPALRVSREEIRDAVQAVPRVHAVRRALGTDAALVFLQASVAVTLLVTGLLIVRSFLTLANTPLGYEPRGVIRINADFPSGLQAGSDRYRFSQRRFLTALAERLGTPVAAAGGLPGITLNTALMRPDASPPQATVLAWPVSGEFFRVMRLTLIRGRVFTDEEAFSNAPAAVIDERATELLWPGADPIGRRVKEADGTVRVIVGVVRTVRSDLLGTRFQRGGGFVPFGKRPTSWSFLYRVAGTSPSVKMLEATAAEVEPGTTVSARPLVIFERQLAEPRFLAMVLGTLGTVAVLLTLIGVFGIVAHEVTRRTKELGIRVALGADSTRIQRLVLKGSLLPAVGGGLLGLSASLWFTGTLRALLYGLNPYDPAVYAGAFALMLVTVCIGSLGPARRASRTDPMAALRGE